MKTAIVLLAIVAVLPPGSPNPDVRPDPSTTANPATSANASAAATALVIFGSDTIRAEVANTSETRSRGLMYRDEVPDGTGMPFVFDREADRPLCSQ